MVLGSGVGVSVVGVVGVVGVLGEREVGEEDAAVEVVECMCCCIIELISCNISIGVLSTVFIVMSSGVEVSLA